MRTKLLFLRCRLELSLKAFIRAFRRFQPIAGAQDPPTPPVPPAPAPPAPPVPAPAASFTQADVDRIVQDRLARERAKFADYDELKAAKAELDQLRAAGQTELERAQAAAAAAETAKAEAEQRAQEARDGANKTLIRAQVIAAAAKAGAVDPDDVYALMEARQFTVHKDDKEIKVTLGDDGQVTGHQEAVTAFLEDKKHLVGQTPPPGPGDGGPRNPPPGALSKDALKQMSPQQVAALKPEEVQAALSG